MRVVALLGALLVLLLAAVRGTFKPEHKCYPGTMFKKDTSWRCECNAGGYSYKCFEGETGGQPGQPEQPGQTGQTEGIGHKVCYPGTVFRGGSSWRCECNADHHSYKCFESKKGRQTGQTEQTEEIEGQDEKFCYPGAVLRKDTSWGCECNADSRSYKCFEGEPDGQPGQTEEDEENGQTGGQGELFCYPGFKFRKGTSRCECNADGTSYKCFEDETGGQTGQSMTIGGQEQICYPNMVFRKGACTYCLCNAEGSSYKCFEDEPGQPSGGQGDTNITAGKYNCGTKIVPMRCRPKTTFRKGCAECRCNAEGTSATCKERNCVTDYLDVSMYTNTEQTPSTCTPNSTFMKDCNKCRCGPDGKLALCTMKLCPPKKEVPEMTDYDEDETTW